MRQLTLTAVLLAVALVAPARAHYLWIEKEPGASTAKVFFGEVAEGVKEKSGGKLDKFQAVQAWAPLINKKGAPSLRVKKMDDHFLIEGIPANAGLVVRDEMVEVADLSKHQIGIVKPLYYARYAFDSPIPYNDLDIVPVEGSPNSFRVMFKRMALAEAKVMIYAPNLWMQEHKTDAIGVVNVSTPWPGQYVLDVTHKEEGKGVFKDKPYEAKRHRATYTFIAEGK
jgi:hypothetical protein